MQFKHPELLYALFLLLIPILIHLFQLRRFKKEAFTNVAILKSVTHQTRKSSQLKKWLILASRLFLLSCLILAFAQPFSYNSNVENTEKETVIYLDNSFSLQQKGAKGELFKRAVQDLINAIDENKTFTLITNTKVFKNTTIKAIKNELLQMPYSSFGLDYNQVLLKVKTVLNKEHISESQLVYISDFQNQNTAFNTEKDSLLDVYFVKLKPTNTNNIALDSLFISKSDPMNTELTVRVKNYGNPQENLSVALYNDDKLMAKSAVDISEEAETVFTISSKDVINGKLTIEDTGLKFDNSLYFNINAPEKINVLSISETDDDFLNRIFNKDEFNFTAIPLKALDYNLIESQHTIVLNELVDIPQTLVNVLKGFTNNGGNLIVIPAKGANISSYNQLLLQFQTKFETFTSTDKLITQINYSHPLYTKDVFEKQVRNFQYPKVNSYYTLGNTTGDSALRFEDGKPFLSKFSNLYLFTAALNTANSNFKNWSLIVPTFYKMATESMQHPKLYYVIGEPNAFDVNVTLHQDEILSISNATEQFIPLQQYYNTKVRVKTQDKPESAGVYAIKNKETPIKSISFNYNRLESNLVYQDLSILTNGTVNNSVESLFETLKSNTKVNELWKWFTIFALAFLIIEMLILKYFK